MDNAGTKIFKAYRKAAETVAGLVLYQDKMQAWQMVVDFCRDERNRRAENKTARKTGRMFLLPPNIITIPCRLRRASATALPSIASWRVSTGSREICLPGWRRWAKLCAKRKIWPKSPPV